MKRNYNRRFFENIDSEEKAYWLGFIAADGSVRLKPDTSVSIGLSKTDENHLHKLSRAVNYDGKLCQKAKSSTLSLYGKQMAADLITHGIIPRKTYTLKPWRGPDTLMQHYWRGFFDGDGCISSTIKKRNYRQWTISIIGTKAMCSGFLKFLKLKYKPWIGDKCGLKVMSWGSLGPCKAIAQKLYGGASCYLERKMLLAEQINSQVMRENKIQVMTNKPMLLQLKKKHGSWENVAKILGVSRNGLYKHVRKLGIKRRSWCARLS